MAKKTRAELRKQGFKLETMKPVAIRLPLDTWEKLQWVAVERGMQRQDVIRLLVADATRNARPPKSRESRTIGATEEEWAAWYDVAEQMGVSLDTLVGRIMKQLTDSSFGKAAD